MKNVMLTGIKMLTIVIAVAQCPVRRFAYTAENTGAP